MNFDGTEVMSSRKRQILSIYGIPTSKGEITKGEINKSEENEIGKPQYEINDENRFDKGQIADRLIYGYGGGESFKFTKTGSELKEHIPGVLAALNTKKGEIIAKMDALKGAAGVDPTNVYWSDAVSGLEVVRYDWKTCDELCEGGNKSCNDYNEWCYVLRDVIDDINALNVIQANLEDSKKYTLSVGQLISLQFNS